MAFAKGKILITHEELIELLGLPEDIEIVSVENSIGEHLELNIASRMPISGFTVDAPHWKHLRRKEMPSEEPMFFRKEDYVFDKGDKKNVCKCGVNLGVVVKYSQDSQLEQVVCAICEKPKN